MLFVCIIMKSNKRIYYVKWMGESPQIKQADIKNHNPTHNARVQDNLYERCLYKEPKEPNYCLIEPLKVVT